MSGSATALSSGHSPGRLQVWVEGARPRTLPAALAPVLVASALVGGSGVALIWWRVAAAGLVALSIQVATNYANDYSDGIRGTDDNRVGPLRIVAGGLAPPHSVKYASFGCFAVAGVAGLALAAATSWWLVAAGAACIAAGWFYTGSSHPYGYAGLGELFVFVFFGLVATAGTVYVLLGHLTFEAVLAGVPMGLAASALLAVNNLRDLDSDCRSHKRTLAVRLGDRRARALYVALLVVAVLAAASLSAYGHLAALASLGAGLPAGLAGWRVVRGAKGRALVPVLGLTGLTQLALAVLLGAGLLIR